MLGHHGAEDCVQDAYTKIIQYAKRPEDIEEYFGTVLRNCIRDAKRDLLLRGAINKELEEQGDLFLDFESSPEEVKENEERIEEISLFIETFPLKQRTVLRMFFVEQRGYKEISALVDDVTYSYIRKLVSEFRKKIKNGSISSFIL